MLDQFSVPCFKLRPHPRCWVDAPGSGWVAPPPRALTRLMEQRVHRVEAGSGVVSCWCRGSPGLRAPPPRPELQPCPRHPQREQMWIRPLKDLELGGHKDMKDRSFNSGGFIFMHLVSDWLRAARLISRKITINRAVSPPRTCVLLLAGELPLQSALPVELHTFTLLLGQGGGRGGGGSWPRGGVHQSW